MSDLVAALDIGAEKVVALLGELNRDGPVSVVGADDKPSQGAVRRGVVVDLDRAAEAARLALMEAQYQPGESARRAYLAVGSYHIRSTVETGIATIRGNRQITQEDVRRAIEQTKTGTYPQDQELLHVIPLEYRVDRQSEAVMDPVGMTGSRLEVRALLVTVDKQVVENLRNLAQRLDLEVPSLVAAPYAAGLGVLEPDELEGTTLVVDLGASTTGVGYFKNGKLAYVGVIPLGAEMITSDISQVLRIPVDEAERIKLLHGTAIREHTTQEEMVELAGGTRKVPRSELAEIIYYRQLEILEAVRRLVEDRIGPFEREVNRVVLTGGGALLAGVDQLARREFGVAAEVKRPIEVEVLSDKVDHPKYAVAVGLLEYARKGWREPESPIEKFKAPWLEKVINWLKELF